ncbi:MAG: sensor histidine kinase, partial [Leptolyngbyaceae cyanobacterium SL_5_9]|nr:sensor histidine kinase [Leptolyngbyaceae cyanobacterium SL_5_9]
FAVLDTGIGISVTDQGKLFQSFQQLDGGLDRRYEGTGLGLALARKLAQLHHGDITVVSEVGKGSCFTLRLPLDP